MSFKHLTGELVVESVVVLNETTRADLGVTSFQGNVHLAWTGSTYSINTMWSHDGHHFGGKQTLEYESLTRGGSGDGGNRPGVPSLASSSSGLLMAWPGETSKRLAPCVMWPGGSVTVVGQDKSHYPITMETPITAWGNGAAIVWLTLRNRLMMATSQGQVFSQPVDLGKAYPPLSVCIVGNELVLAAGGKGFRSNQNIFCSRDGVFGQPVNLRGVGATKVCALGNELTAVWKQRRSRYIGFLRDGRLIPVLEMPKQHRLLSTEYPSLCEHNGGLIVAWPGDNGNIHVAQIRRTQTFSRLGMRTGSNSVTSRSELKPPELGRYSWPTP